MRLQTFKIAILMLITLAVDQGTKYWSQIKLLVFDDPLNTRIYQGSRFLVARFGDPSSTVNPPISSPWLSLEFNYVRNHGAAWGFLRDLPEHVRLPLFHVTTVFFCVLFLGFAVSPRLNLNLLTRFGLCLSVSGALGNFVDRLMKGYVVDLLDFKWNLLGWAYSPPVFNFADIFVVIGLFLTAASSATPLTNAPK